VDVRPVDDLLDPATTGVDNDTDPVPLVLVHRRKVDPRIADRLGPGAHRELDEATHPSGHLCVHHGRRVEVEDLGRDPNLERGRIEALDLARPGHPGDQVRPIRLEVIADRHDGPEPGDDGPPGRILFRRQCDSSRSDSSGDCSDGSQDVSPRRSA